VNTNSSTDRLIETFSEAQAKPAGVEREHFLTHTCRGDPELRKQVVALLRAHERAGDFMQLPCQAEEASDVIDRYRVRELIGEGGFGAVYVADQEVPVRRRVALKLIKLGLDTRAVVARFEAERQALAMMDHPNIAKVLDAGATSAGRPYFVMELVRGTRITDYCKEKGLGVQERLTLFIQVCQAVQHAHQKGVIHRDLKPSNVLVTLQDPDRIATPKIIDFGIAKAVEGRLTDSTVHTRLHHFVGTPAYMSPEQAEMSPDPSGDIDTRSDIYSLGILLYELLTGTTPFDEQELLSKGLDAMRRTIREREPDRPSTRLTQLQARASRDPESQIQNQIFKIDKDLDWIVMKCLEKDRTRRYETANGLAVDLKHYLNSEPVTARPPSTAYRLQKAFRRNRVAFTTAAVVAAALLTGLLASLWQTREANRARTLAQEARAAAQRQIYIDSMNLARQAWDDNNVRHVRDLLGTTATEKDRGFEWYYWQRQMHLELATLRGHLGPVSGVAFSPDCTRILTGSFDGRAIVWHAGLGSRLLILTGHVGRIQSVSWSPDGQSIALAGDENAAEVWDASANRLRFSLIGHMDALTSIAFSPDGQRLVTASRDGEAKVWDSADGRQLERLEHRGPVWTAMFSADGQRVLTAAGEEKAIVWDLGTGATSKPIKAPPSQNPMRELDGFPRKPPFTAIFSLGERWIITGSQNQTVRFWDPVSGGESLSALKGNPYRLSPRESDIPFSIALSPDGERLLTGGFDQVATLWSVKGGARLFELKGHQGEIGSVAFSPDGKRVLTGSFDSTAKVWDAIATREAHLLGDHRKVVTCAAFSPDSQRIVTSSWDRTAKVWDVATRAMLLNLAHSHLVWAAAFSPDGRRIVTGCGDGTVSIWNALTGESILTFRAHGANAVTGVRFSPSGDRILTNGEDGTARVWDAASCQQLLRLRHPYRYVTASVFSPPDARRIVTAAQDNDPTTSEDGPAFVWDSISGQQLFRIPGHLGGISSLACSPDGRRIITGSMDRTAKIWDAVSGQPLKTLTGHRNTVIRVGFSPDGRRIITTAFDYTTRLWDATTFQEVLNLKDHLFLAISPDGQRMVSGGGQPAQVLEIASEEDVARWRQEEERAVLAPH
jgi:eukaryotic-like serine/threonine-protein kinase